MTSQLLLLLLLSGTGCIAQTSSPRDGGGDSELTTDSSPVNETPALEVPVATQTPFNCLTEWLILAGASHDKATMIAQSQQAKQSGLDEITITRLEDFVLSILLGFDAQLATQLKRCIVISTTCPSGAMTTKFPCSKTGKCVFNQEQGSTLCQCPAGLTGERCEVDIDECQDVSLNDCDDDAVAICLNSYGSFACECRSGYIAHGRDCPDLDECASDTHSCHRHANCTNTIGSYTCLCQDGYQGNGTRCEVDVCASSANSRLCRKIESIDTYNKHLEKKLKQRDRQIASLLSDVRLISTVFTRYHHTISNLGTRLHNTEVKLQDARQDLDYTRQDLTSTKQDLTATRQDLTSTKRELTTTQHNLTRLDHDLPARVASNEQSVHSLTKEVKRHDKQCGIVSWKSYSQQTDSTKDIHPWSVVYNKTRSDTILRVQYTSTFGLHSRFSQWFCFTISIRINNTECADPAPIKSGASAYTQDSSYTRTILPGAISGTCRINATGQLTFSTHIEKHCYNPTNYKFDGYYHQGGQRITATLHVEELCPN